jgi:endonuclease IV
MEKMENLLLVAGTGRNSGKTTMVCRIIRQFRNLDIVAVKISPHFHDPSKGLALVLENKGYNIYEETDQRTLKDSSQMLKCGAERVFFAQIAEGYLREAFSEIIKDIPVNRPVVCESPALIKYIEPGVLIIMISENKLNKKIITEMQFVHHSEYTLKELSETDTLPFKFSKGVWTYR